MIYLANQHQPDHKTIIITESQKRKLLNEAADADFNTNNINGAFNQMKRYCDTHLGNRIGSGSSRLVYQIDDNRVLKLARNQKGIAQNDVESQMYHQNFDIFPKIFNKSPDGLWIDCEYVLPAKAADFQQCLGMKWKDVCEIINQIASQYSRYSYRNYSDENWKHLEELMYNNHFFYELNDYMSNEQIPPGDLLRLANWGMTMRDGQATMVILDSGFNEQVWKDYYRR